MKSVKCIGTQLAILKKHVADCVRWWAQTHRLHDMKRIDFPFPGMGAGTSGRQTLAELLLHDIV
jgi:hypothetical protein